MLQRILVPVDGSPLSDRALPYASLLARAQGAKITLLRVLEPLIWNSIDDGVGFGYSYADPETYDKIMDGIREDANDRLLQSQETLRASGADSEAILREGFATSALLDEEAQIAPDLVVMSTHGRTGLARFTLGSVADRLVREGSVPVLLIPAFGEGEPLLDRALVPLDGSPVAEQALPMVESLAAKPLQSVQLLTALGDATPRLLSSDAPPEAVVTATEYLQGVASRLAKVGLATTVSVTGDDPVEAIDAAAASADLVIMSTHGRGGLDRWRHGSVAERTSRHITTPRLLVRAR